MYIVPHYKTKKQNKRQDGDHYRRRKKKGLERATAVPRVSTQVLRLLYLFGTLPISSLPMYTYIHCLYIPASSATTHVYYVSYLCSLLEPLMRMLLSGSHRTLVSEGALSCLSSSPPSYREDASEVSGLHCLRWHSQDKNPAFLILRPGLSFQSSCLLPLWVPAKW